jgi:hypothetical protein
MGVKIGKVKSCMAYPEESIVFDKWVEKLFSLRAKAPNGGKSGPFGIFLKYFLNSLTGKFGSRIDQRECMLCFDPSEIVPCSDPSGECDGECGHWTPLDDDGTIFTKLVHRMPSCGHIEWAAYLTSLARIEWHKQAVSKNEGLDMVYGDTDSVFCTRSRDYNLGSDLGHWEEGKNWKNFSGTAPKAYRLEYLDKTGTEKHLKVRAKGAHMPRDMEKADKLLATGYVPGKAYPLGFWAAARKGKFFTTGSTSRRFQKGYGDRILEKGARITRAPTVKEVLEKEK